MLPNLTKDQNNVSVVVPDPSFWLPAHAVRAGLLVQDIKPLFASLTRAQVCICSGRTVCAAAMATFVNLSTKVKMPIVGLGTWQVSGRSWATPSPQEPLWHFFFFAQRLPRVLNSRARTQVAFFSQRCSRLQNYEGGFHRNDDSSYSKHQVDVVC